jgi:hypothetical protein
MHRVRAVLAFVLIAAGLVWFGQGVGLIPGSFMTGNSTWAWIGAACVIVGALIAAFELRSRSAEPR